uniref:CMRF35-like molecule 3 n=1 Tax=Epinephelus lanceolatus TaxID=310571 RepID=UPI001444FBB2|nr:CMRF35-like molecule 3 [Epinephelus lanceolatus]
MRTSGISLGFFNAPVFCLFWLTKHAVDSAELSAPEVVTGVIGGSVTVHCQYDRQFRNYTKYWCKGQIYELCEIVVKTPKMRNSERHSIADDKEAGVFTVTMTSLRESDKDKYWCVIARHGRNTHTGVRLRISESDTVITTTAATTTAKTPEEDEVSWWATLRWILFILMLCCLVSTHVIVWRIKAAGKTQLQHEVQYQNTNIYA